MEAIRAIETGVLSQACPGCFPCRAPSQGYFGSELIGKSVIPMAKRAAGRIAVGNGEATSSRTADLRIRLSGAGS